MSRFVVALVAPTLFLAASLAARAEILRWTTYQPIPGTEGLSPEPGVQLDHRELDYALLSKTDLKSARFDFSSIGYGWFDGADLTGASLVKASLYSAKLNEAKLIGADLSGAGLYQANLTNADFGGAIVAGASFSDTTSRGFTRAQLVATLSYQEKKLGGIDLSFNDLNGWGFSGQDLTAARFYRSSLAGTDFSGAVVQGADLSSVFDRGFTLSQLYSTKSYQAKDLGSIDLSGNDLHGADFAGHNLTGASFAYASLGGVDFSNAVVQGARFEGAVERGFASGQLYSTKGYQEKQLAGMDFNFNDLSGWNFADQDLSVAALNHVNFTDAELSGARAPGASLYNSNLTNAKLTHADLSDASLELANFSGANLAGASLVGASATETKFVGANLAGADLRRANFGRSDFAGADLSGAIVSATILWDTTSRGLSEAQLKATQSYQDKDLRGIQLLENDLRGWDFSGQNLSDSVFRAAQLTGASFAGALLQGAEFEYTTGTGFTKDQLYSTKSYQDKNLAGFGLEHNDLRGWNFDGQNLRGGNVGSSSLENASFAAADLRDVYLDYSTLSSTDFRLADLRGARFPDHPGSSLTKNAILPDGAVAGLDLAAGQQLVVRNDNGVPGPGANLWPPARESMGIAVKDHLTMAAGSALRLQFDAEDWRSSISFGPGIPVSLGGSLELVFTGSADAEQQVGRTFDLFDWTGAALSGSFSVTSAYDWDLSRLYDTGQVTLLAAGGRVAGDADADGRVDLNDFGILKTHFGAVGGIAEGDANRSGGIDLADFGLLKLNFGKHAAAAVPEPTTGLLSLCAIVILSGWTYWQRRAPTSSLVLPSLTIGGAA